MYTLFRVISWSLGRLSDSSFERLARFLGWLAFGCLGVRRAVTLRNLDIVFGDTKTTREKAEIAALSGYHFVLCVLEGFRFFPGRAHEKITFLGREQLETALQEGRGAYILCVHAGSGDSMAAAIARTFCPCYIPAKRASSPGVDRFITEMRQNFGLATPPRFKKGDGFRMIQATLQAGQIVGFPMDQARAGAPRMLLFGQPARTNTSLAGIWRRQKAPILPGVIRRTGRHQSEVTFFPPLELIETDHLEADVIANTEIFNRWVERLMLFNPSEYFWLHDRWK